METSRIPNRLGFPFAGIRSSRSIPYPSTCALQRDDLSFVLSCLLYCYESASFAWHGSYRLPVVMVDFLVSMDFVLFGLHPIEAGLVLYVFLSSHSLSSRLHKHVVIICC
jgi:hypothetical protein